jgi:hypothetical protein
MASQVFLSHAGEDGKLAVELAARLKDALNASRMSVRVFNTSASEDRFRDFEDIVAAGEEFRPLEWEAELRDYLRQELRRSAVYILLVTPGSLRKSSKWIQFEIDTAFEEQARGRIAFIPCTAKGARLKDLPDKASVFQGIDLSKEQGWHAAARGEEQLLHSIATIIARDEDGDDHGQQAG